MTQRTIPKQKFIICDRCSARVDNAGSPPTGWTRITIDAPREWHNEGFTRDVCAKCSDHVLAGINAALTEPEGR